MKVDQVLNFIDSGDIALPEFQRGYVWNREQVRGLFTSLYRGYPVGGFMTWNTPAEGAAARGGVSTDGTVKLLLDGQQRATSLYGVLRGRAPKFFEGNAQAFTGLFFNVLDETFEFYAPAKMKNDPSWIDVSALMQGSAGVGSLIQPMMQLAEHDNERFATYLERLNNLASIARREMHVEEVVGPDKTIDVVVDIFNRVNSGGTKLSKGDLALAKVCAAWPEARQQFNDTLEVWKQAGFHFKLDWLLRVVNGVVTGKAPFTALANVPVPEIKRGLKLAQQYISAWLDVIAGRLGLDHDRVLFSKFALVIMARHMHNEGGRLPDTAGQNKMLAWFAHTGMWGRFAGSTESVLAQDLEAVDARGVDGLLDLMRQSRGDLVVRESDFAGSTLGSRFYPTLYMLTRTQAARDFGTGGVLSASLLGRLSSLDVHHIFPKAKLYGREFERADVNAVANFCFLTKETNIRISASDPDVYLPKVEADHPGALNSQWVPSDRSLWNLDRFADFLASRRELLAAAANTVLGQLEAGGATSTSDLGRGQGANLAEGEAEPEAAQLRELVAWMLSEGYSEPEYDVEVADPVTGEQLCTAEAFWANGLQEGIGSPVVLELDEASAEDRVASRGYHVFNTVEALRKYVRHELSQA